MKYNVGDKVRIKSLDWYNENKDEFGNIDINEDFTFYADRSKYCGKVFTISEVFDNCYTVKEDNNEYYWADEMFEGFVEPIDCKKCGLTRNSTRCLFMDNCPHTKPKNIIEIPEDCVLKDENGNIINTTKIILEKKGKEYPKTYEECCKVLSLGEDGKLYTKGYKASLIQDFQKLLIRRDAYWKIAGDEMGLGKPWEPDWNNISDKYCIYFVSGDAWLEKCQTRQCPFAFPTAEMRDAFYENFKVEIEQCKELL